MLKVQTLTFAALLVQGVASIGWLEAGPALAVLAAPAALAVALAHTLAPGHCGDSRHQDDGVGNINFFGGDKERAGVQCSVLCCLIHIIKVHLCLAPPTPSPPTRRGVTVASHHNHHLHFSNQIWRRPTNAQIKIF